MSAPIGRGDQVVCVDASPYEGGPSLLVLGATYTVEAVWDYLPHRGDPASEWYDCAIDLVGVPSPAEGLAWGLYRFRPAGPAPDPIFALKRPAPFEREPQPA